MNGKDGTHRTAIALADHGFVSQAGRIVAHFIGGPPHPRNLFRRKHVVKDDEAVAFEVFDQLRVDWRCASGICVPDAVTPCNRLRFS